MELLSFRSRFFSNRLPGRPHITCIDCAFRSPPQTPNHTDTTETQTDRPHGNTDPTVQAQGPWSSSLHASTRRTTPEGPSQRAARGAAPCGVRASARECAHSVSANILRVIPRKRLKSRRADFPSLQPCNRKKHTHATTPTHSPLGRCSRLASYSCCPAGPSACLVLSTQQHRLARAGMMWYQCMAIEPVRSHANAGRSL